LQGGALRFLDGGGPTGVLIRAHDWAATPIGSPETWPSELKTLVGVMLAAAQPMFVAWGRTARTMIYNDEYAALLGPKHPKGLGRSFDDVWPEAMGDLEPLFQAVYRGEPIHSADIVLYVDRGGGPAEAHFAFSYTPVRDETGTIVGLFCPCRETTQDIFAECTRDAERARTERLFTHAPGFIAILEGAEHRFTYVNAAYRAIVGEREYIGHTAREALPEIAGQGFLEFLDEVYESGTAKRVSGQLLRLGATSTTPAREIIIDFVYQAIVGDDGAVSGIFVEGHEATERTRVEQALRASEARFRAAVDAVHGVLWTNTPEGEMRGEQPGWAELTGQSFDEYQGYGWSKAVHPDDAGPTIQAWNEAVAERRPFEFEHRVAREDGQWRAYAVRAVPTFDADGAITEWIGVHTDVTDERAVQAALIESEENYRYTVELHPQVAWTATPDGLLDHVADRWREWTGMSGLGDSWGQSLHPEDLDHSNEAWLHSVMTHSPYDVEHRVARSGSYRWARSRAFPRRDNAGRVVKWYGTTEDIDDRKRAEVQAFASARELRGVVDALPGFVWTADTQGLITYTSPMWHAYSGSTPAQSLGVGWAEFVHPEDQRAAFEQWGKSLETGEPYEVEFRLRSAGGTYHWWLARAHKQVETGQWIGTATELDAIVAARNMLARSREELEHEVLARTSQLRETEEQLRQSQKLEAIGQLTGGVAHDFNNLLTVIRGSIDLLRRPGITDEKRLRYMEAISDTVTRAAKLTGQLLAFARRQALKPENFDVCRAIDEIRPMIGTLAGSRIRVELQLPEAPLHVDADRSQFDTAIVNLAANARDAMDADGILKISVEVVDTDDGEHVAVRVIDSGVGISPAAQMQIFEPFFTTKGVGQGTGLGLSQVYGFSKQSGGEVTVRSAPGEGAVFTICLPRVAPNAISNDEAERALSDGQGTRVLIVEDNPEVGQFAQATLDELGYATDYVESGEAALALLSSDAGRFDIVFSDVMMPGMTGIELAETIRHRHPGLPVLLTSGYSHVLVEHGSSGFDLLNKPYSMEELSAALRATARRPATA
jgi:PAS domain S-box-containing protein